MSSNLNIEQLRQTIQACIRNDRKGQERLYRQYFPVMRSMVRRYTLDEEKQISIINDGFLKVFKSISSYEHKGSFEGWIRRIVYRSMSDFFRKENKYLQAVVLEVPDAPQQDNALDSLYYDDLMKIIDLLPNKMNKVFHLYAIEGYTHKEIGERLDISEGTSKWYLSEARKSIIKYLKKHKNSISHAG